MTVMIVLIAVSLVVAVGFLIAFLSSASAGQFDDISTPAKRMLLDNTIEKSKKKLK